MFKKNTFGNKGIAGKVKFGFGLTSGIIASICVMGIISMSTSAHRYKDLYVSHGEGRGYISEVGLNFADIRYDIVNMLYTTGESDVVSGASASDSSKVSETKYNEGANKINSYKTDLSKNMKEYIDSLSDGESKKRAEEIESLVGEYYVLVDKAMTFIKNGDTQSATKVVNEDITNISNKLKEKIEFEVNWQSEEGFKDSVNIASETKFIIGVLMILSVATVSISIYIGLRLFKDIKGPLEDLLDSTEKLSDGDLTVNFNIHNDDEIGKLAKALNKMSNNLDSIVIGIGDAAGKVSASSKEISNSAQVLAEGSTEQASSVEELMASVHEIATKTSLNAENASKAKEYMDITREGAIEGSRQMSKMVAATAEIQQASSDISKIIKVIDEIAFQTNILALNAAVEAARAGQHGKGFAVVADEVRNLAVRSANAVKETSALIESSINKSEVGAELASATENALQKILEDVSNVSDLINDIANSSNEQSLGIQQINVGIGQVSDVVQTTSATAEESAAASQELASQAESLTAEVDKFKVSNDGYALDMLDVIDGMSKKTGDIEINLDDDFGKY